jgi:Zn finger protein HypA/HybF involved in hydrogenase expression
MGRKKKLVIAKIEKYGKEKKVFLSEQIETKPKGNAECLKCEKRFYSKGPHNRLCDGCASTNERSFDGLNW